MGYLGPIGVRGGWKGSTKRLGGVPGLMSSATQFPPHLHGGEAAYDRVFERPWHLSAATESSSSHRAVSARKIPSPKEGLPVDGNYPVISGAGKAAGRDGDCGELKRIFNV